MALKYPNGWRYGEDEDIPPAAINALSQLASRIAASSDNPQGVFEGFKRRFGSTGWSSNASWAESDMLRYMREHKGTRASFVEAFWLGVCDANEAGLDVPSSERVSQIAQTNGLPFAIEPPNLRFVSTAAPASTSDKGGHLSVNYAPATPVTPDDEDPFGDPLDPTVGGPATEELATDSAFIDAPPNESAPFADPEVLAAAVAHALVARERHEEARLIASAKVRLEYVEYDNWDGGTTSWLLSLYVPFELFTRWSNMEKSDLEKFATEIVKSFLPEKGYWCSAKLKPQAVNDADWRANVLAASHPAQPKAPTPLGDSKDDADFVVRERLGAGAHGATYRGDQLSLRREVALKWLNPSAPAALVAREQASGLARARHDNVVVVYQVTKLPNPRTKETADCIVMEFIEGRTLADTLRGGVDRLTLIAAGHGIIAGILHIHHVGLTHGDLHGENVLLRSSDSRAIIIDLQYWGALATATTMTPSADVMRDVRGLADILYQILSVAALDPNAAMTFRTETRRAETIDAVADSYHRAVGSEEAPDDLPF